ncbi:ankyrin repeat domain-containing protein 26-like isoform X2 [Misgurnus anguillicaudatus]|uniref:ankyrin repeat domain-containing protein 26-like isoform X2 n=1 Tax=Misgurnus anguillicaudatus TaxID=75329 RepID=UPI003CCF01AC
MKKIFNFKKKKGSPSPSETGSVLSASYDVKEKDLGKVHKAAYGGDVTKLRQLAKKSDLNQLDKDNRTALHIACACGHTDVVQFLVENKVKLNLCDNQNRSALMKAVQCEQDRCVSLLLDHEADPNLVDINGNTALHLAARIPSLPVAMQLLEHAANINAQNKDGNTPLMLAVMENHTDMTELLLKEGADVNVKNQEQRSVLMIAACNGQISMVRLLLQYDADITAKDDKGWSSDDYAVMNGHHACSHLIIEHGTKRKSLQSPSHFTAGKNRGASMLGSPGGIGAGLHLGGPALDKDAGSSFAGAGKDTEDISHTDSISRASKSGAADSWASSEDDQEIDCSPKKQKVNLKKLISASKREKIEDIANPVKSWSGSESESEGKPGKYPPLPSRSTSTQLPVASLPASLPHPSQMSSGPFSNTYKEESSTEDEEEEDDIEEEDENKEQKKLCEKPQNGGTTKEKQRDFLSELGLEKEDEHNDSPWDSESGSESPTKKPHPAKSHRSMSSVCEENPEDFLYVPSFVSRGRNVNFLGSIDQLGGCRTVVLRNDEDDEEEKEIEIPPKVIKREPVSVLNKLMDSKEAAKKTDLMEELGLGDADDLEDASDWDSASTTSKASKNFPVYKMEEEPDQPAPAFPITPLEQDEDENTIEVKDTHPETNKSTTPLPSPRSLNADASSKPRPLPRLRLDSNQRPESEESDWDTDASSPAKITNSLPNITEPDAGPRQEHTTEDDESDRSSGTSEREDQGDKADDMRGEHQNSVLWDTGGSRVGDELDQGKGRKTDTNFGNSKPQERISGERKKDSVSSRHLTRSLRRTNRAPAHDEDEEEQKMLDNQARNLHVAPPLLGKPPRPVTRHNGDIESVFDDSTLSELSEEDRRSPSSRRKKEQTDGEPEMGDDFEDLTQSSDTATEDLETPVSGYRNASLLFKQLDSSYLDSVSVVKLQNMFHEYERTIQRERDRHGRLADKTTQLEQERSELRILLDEMRSSKSNLEHLKLELETDMNNLKFLLRQEQEKHQSALMLYNKTREQLQRKEEQQRAEAEERHKADLKARSLELEIRALKNSIKQLEEDRDESQRLLSHERSARTLHEELLSNHLRKQQDIEEENLRNFNKSNEAMSQLTEASDRERELLQQNRALHDELNGARAELDRSQSHSRQEESRLAEERDALRERLEDARRDLKLSDEALTQTVFQYNGQLSALKAECSVIAAKLEHERQTRQQLEAEAEANRARLQGALHEAERCQASRTEAERTLQREREEHQRSQEKHTFESNAQRDTIQSLSQKLSKAEARANSLENECHRSSLAVTEKGVLLEALAREKDQAQAKLKDLEAAVLSEREQASRAGAKQEAMQERLAQAQSECALLRQKLEEALNKGSAKDKAVTDSQQNFAEMLNQLRADGEERVHLVEERSKELSRTNSEIREQNYKLEQEKSEREASLRQLQQELADSLKKLSMCEASLEVNTRYRNDLEEEKMRTLKELDRLKGKLQESEDLHVQAERRIGQLKNSLDEKEREICITAQKLEEALAASAGKEQTVKQLEEAVQRLEIENARLEATVKQQSSRMEVLQKGVQEGSAVRNRLEDLVTNLQSSKMTLEDQLNREVQKQSLLSHNAQDSQTLWEEELKSRSRLGLRLSELEKEKVELTNQVELEKKKAKKLAEQKSSVDTRLEQEMNRNTDLQKEMYRLKTLVKSAKKQLREQGGGHLDSPLASFRGDTSHRLETETTVSRMKTKVDELQSQYQQESLRCSRLEETNRQLKEKLASVKTLSRSHEQLERSKRQLEDEVAALRKQLQGGVMDQSQAELYRRETEERARQEIRLKLEEVNLFLQTQAASQEALEQMKAANEASQRAHLEQRIRDLEAELSRSRSVQQDSTVQRDSSRTEMERYKQLYTDELRLRKSLASKLERSHERLAEANAKLLSERQRSKSLLTGSLVNGGLGGAALDVSSLGSVGAYGASLGPLNRSLGLGTPLLGTVGEFQNNRVEAYLAKMQKELEKNISKELDYVAGELDGGSARLSPVGSASGSQNLNLTLEQPDPVKKATQQYLEVLKKNYMI